jgi:hypothetical protein
LKRIAEEQKKLLGLENGLKGDKEYS